MTSNKILTVVVPVYKVENYIEQCLSSFVVEEIMDKVEILVIDDETPDASAAIARKYEKQYPKTFRVISKKNGGHGSAINRGIEEAVGKYFKIVDGDDWVDKSAFLKLLSFLEKQNCDLVYNNYCWIKEGTGKSILDQKKPFRSVEYNKLYAFEEISGKTFFKMHNITFKTEILKKYCKKITEKSFYVDCEYILYPIPFVKTVVFLEEVLYMYRIGRDEQSINIQKMREQCGQHEKILYNLLDFYREYKDKVSKKTADYMAKGIMKMFCSQIKIYLSYKPQKKYKDRIIMLDHELMNEFPEIYRMVDNKAIILLRISNYSLYKAGSIIYRWIYST